ASFAAVVAAVLAAGLPPVGDACGLGVSLPHACCDTPPPQNDHACCPVKTVTAPSFDDLGCHCAHRQPAAAVLAVAAPAPDGSGHAGPVVGLGGVGGPASSLGTPRSHARPLRAHPPPPLFLVDCAFLT
ncbi:MAG: hypothetical protein PVG53_08240, partial [Holophagae bacterium]